MKTKHYKFSYSMFYIFIHICEQDANKIQPNDNPENDKSVPQLKKIIGCDIYKEFKGVKVLGTVTNYMPSANLFEVWIHSFIYN